MANEPDSPAVCPPHHWLITEQGGSAGLQVWTCRRCATTKEIQANDAQPGAQGPWQRASGRSSSRSRGDNGTTPPSEEPK